MPDGTVIWNSPSGHTYVTTPGSALLFPSLCVPTGGLIPPNPARAERCTDRVVMMPKLVVPAPRIAPATSPPNAVKTTKHSKPAGPHRKPHPLVPHQPDDDPMPF